jgi:hypothetical protein
MNVDFASNTDYIRWGELYNYDPNIIEQWRNGDITSPRTTEHDALTREIRDQLIRDVITAGTDPTTGEPTIYLGWFVTDDRAARFAAQLDELEEDQKATAYALASSWHGTLDGLINAAKELTR